VIARAQAMFDFPGEDEEDLPFKFGEIINVVEFGKFFSVSRLLFNVIVAVSSLFSPTHTLSSTNVIVNDDWWRGILGKDIGIFPAAYVQL